LVFAIAALLVQLAWPSITAWQNRPRSGRQVAQTVELEHYGHLRFLLYLPHNYDKQSASWPLLVYLHGAGTRGNDVHQVATEGPPLRIVQGDRPPFIIAAPQCPMNQYWQPEIVHALAERLATTYSVNRDQVYLTGYSMGGYGTWATAAAYPSQFAAIVPIAGGGQTDSAADLAKMPIWAFHGEHDDVIPLSASRDMVKAVQSAGGHAKLTVLKNKGHGICNLAYADERIYAWLIKQTKRQSQHVTLRARPESLEGSSQDSYKILRQASK
jgi:predicted peptidase